MAEGNVSGGGVHPGKPIIWPTGKGSASSSSQSATVSSAGSVASTGGAKASVSTAQTSAAQAAVQSGATQAAATTAPTVARPATAVSRPQTLQDISTLLLTNNIPDTPGNRSIALQLLNHGYELSRANFVNVLSSLEGTNYSQQAIEAALIMLGKDIASQPAMKMLSQHIQNNPQLSGQLEALAQELSTTLGVVKALSSAGVVGKLAEILVQVEKKLVSLSETYKFTGDGSLTREELVNDLRALKSLAEGVKEQAAQASSQTASSEQTSGSAALQSSLENIAKYASGALEHLTSQAVLSKAADRADSNYVVYNVPNPAVTGEDVVIQVRRDGAGVKAEIDAKKTQVVLAMDTKNLGKLHIVLAVKEENEKKNVAAVFNTETDEAKEMIAQNSGDFLKSMAEKECIVTSFHAVKNPDVTVVDYYLPKIGLDDLMKVDVQA